MSRLHGDELRNVGTYGDVIVPAAKPKKRVLHEQAGIFLNYRHDAECDVTKKINHVLSQTRKYKTAPPTVGLDARIREAGLDPHTLESLAIRQAVTEHGLEKKGPASAEEIQEAMNSLQAQMDALLETPVDPTPTELAPSFVEAPTVGELASGPKAKMTSKNTVTQIKIHLDEAGKVYSAKLTKAELLLLCNPVVNSVDDL